MTVSGSTIYHRPGGTGHRNRWLLAIPAAILALVVLRQGYIDTLVKLPQPAAAELRQPWPASGPAMLRADFQRDGTPVVDRQTDNAAAVAFLNNRLPLNPVPYAAAGNVAFAAGDRERGIKLYEIARRQDPRSPLLRRQLAQAYLSNGQVEPAVAEIFAGAELGGRTATLLMQVLRTTGDNPGIGKRIIGVVQQQPRRAATFYRYLPAADAIRPLSRSMLRSFPPSTRQANAYIPHLLAAGYHEDAIALARSVGELPAKGALAWPQDAGFAHALGTGPFDWRDASRSNGRAAQVAQSSWGKVPALDAIYSGTGKETLVQQSIVLPPGPHTWSIPYEVPYARGEGAALTWVLRCNDGSELARASLTGASPQRGTLTLSATVPATQGCTAQSLSLEGNSDDRRSELNAQFRGFERPGKGAGA